MRDGGRAETRREERGRAFAAAGLIALLGGVAPGPAVAAGDRLVAELAHDPAASGDAEAMDRRAATGAPRVRIEQLRWLAGCWAAEGGEAGSGEQWTRPAGGTMLGTNRTVRGGRTVAREFLEIRETDAGDLVYVASPSGQQTTGFRLTQLEGESAVFENPAHDFPQRILYRLEEGGRLAARIEGLNDGEPDSRDFPMRRIACTP